MVEKVKGLRSPVSWFGGKHYMRTKILPLMPEHTHYLEVFGGGASLLFGKEPVQLEVYNDIHDGLYALFKVLREPSLFARFYEKVVLVDAFADGISSCA